MVVDKFGVLVVPGAEFGAHLAAVDEEGGTGDVAGGVAGEEGDGLGDFARLAAAAERDGAEIVLQGFRLGEVGLGEGGADEAGADGVDADAVGAEFIGGGMQNAEDSGFAGVVGDQVGFAIVAVGGGGEHDGAAAAGLHVGGGELDGAEDAGEVDVEGAGEEFVGGVGEGHVAADAGVSDDGIDGVEPLERGFERVALGYVDGGEVEDVDGGAEVAEEADGSCADAGGSAGNDDSLVVEANHAS